MLKLFIVIFVRFWIHIHIIMNFVLLSSCTLWNMMLFIASEQPIVSSLWLETVTAVQCGR
jgi:hypothetical protein